MDNLEHEPSEKKETSSSLGPGASNADSSNPASTWHEIFKSPENPNYGYVDSLEEAMLLLKKYEQETTTKFSCYKSDKMFGSGGRTFFSPYWVWGLYKISKGVCHMYKDHFPDNKHKDNNNNKF